MLHVVYFVINFITCIAKYKCSGRSVIH